MVGQGGCRTEPCHHIVGMFSPCVYMGSLRVLRLPPKVQRYAVTQGLVEENGWMDGSSYSF